MTTLPQVSLDQCEQAQTSTILSLSGSLETKLHLVNLGFHTQSHVKVVMLRGDSMVITVDGSRFAIDKNIAKNIKVQLLS